MKAVAVPRFMPGIQISLPALDGAANANATAFAIRELGLTLSIAI
jgi:hypothetical protein